MNNRPYTDLTSTSEATMNDFRDDKQIDIKSNNRARYVWDYDLTQEQFDEILAGRYEDGHLNRDWAAIRIIEWAKYREMVRILGFPALVNNWQRWRKRIRSEEQRRSIDFLVEWLPKHHPELLKEDLNCDKS